jgi:hypothetical protein
LGGDWLGIALHRVQKHCPTMGYEGDGRDAQPCHRVLLAVERHMFEEVVGLRAGIEVQNRTGDRGDEALVKWEQECGSCCFRRRLWPVCSYRYYPLEMTDVGDRSDARSNPCRQHRWSDVIV